jgi:putative peptide zinc metalloprotease protein
MFDQAALAIMEEELTAAEADRDLIVQRIDETVIRAPTDGQVILPGETDLVGRFARRGDLLAVVAAFEDPVIRVLVPEAQADLVRASTEALHVRLVSDPDVVHTASITRTAPGLTRQLPSRAMSTEGGGRFALDPTAPPNELRTVEAVLNLDLALDGAPRVPAYGERAYARFAHGETPLAGRIYRAATRIFLRYFSTLDTGF